MRVWGETAAAILLLGQVAATEALARSRHPQPSARVQQAHPAPAPEPAEARRERVAELVRSAARAAGFDPELLLAIAMAESSLREHVRNPRSSAAGPMQFSATTWMRAIPRFAARIPELAPHARRMEELAAQERRLSQGKAPPRRRRAQLAALRRERAVAERAALALRHDARIAARVAAALAQEDAERYRSLTGERPATAADIYAVHLLGVGTAAELAKAARQRPNASVATVLPAGVLSANPEIFAGPGGKPLPVRQARERIAARLVPVEPPPVQVAEAP
ncbi:MAG: transglycosylase SLT domain-containing protein [Acetobacteraceae bacterium]|nr:transglycosylase SLT domain-containing protein [Acetobacteraceae bacterium]